MDSGYTFRISDVGIDLVELGLRLRAYRIGAGLKAEDIAKSLNISRAAVYLLEKGDIVKVDALVRLARLFKVSLASLLGVEMEYYSTASGYFERMSQLEAESSHLLANFEPISFLLTTDNYLQHLRDMLLDAAPAGAAAKTRWARQVEEIIAVFAARKLDFSIRHPGITSLIGMREIERFLRFGLLRRDNLPVAIRNRRSKAVRDEIDHIVALMEAAPIGVQVGTVEGSTPGVNFQIFRQTTRSYVGVSPLRLHEIPEVNTAVATITASSEAVALYEKMFAIWWARAHKGHEGAQRIKQLASRIHRKSTP